MNSERVPILKMGHFLLVTIQGEMHDTLATTLQQELTAKVSSTGARGVLLDISGLAMVDSFMGRMVSTISSMTRMMDAETVVVGMQPAVAITLIEMGLTLPGVLTAMDVEKGMELLRSRIGFSREDSNGYGVFERESNGC
ncbi:MAG TPA: STAS domain-containing protein [Oculatellaceae cyanobacterium]